MDGKINDFTMKKLFTLLAAAAMLCVVGCEETPSNEPGNSGGGDVENPIPADNKIIEFEDGTARRICVDNWDTDGDGELSYGEARAIKNLDGRFYYSDMSSFNEFQYFTGIESIASNEFSNCSNLESIIIPNSVKTILYRAFDYCRRLTNVQIPGSVKTIGQSAFAHCGSLTSISIPDGVETIKNDAFMYCISLTNISIPGSVKTIGNGTFFNCRNLTDVTLSDGVETIEAGAFQDCESLTGITIPGSVKTIGMSAFLYCENLTKVYCKALTPPTIENYTFGSNKKITLYVPVGSLEAYTSAYYGKDGIDKIVEMAF